MKGCIKCLFKNRLIIKFLSIFFLALLPLLSCVLAASPTSAVSFRFDNSSPVTWSSSTLFRRVNGSLAAAEFLDSNRVAFLGSDNSPSQASNFVQLVASSGFSKGRVVQLNYAVMYNRDAVWSGFSCDGECMVLEQSFVADSGPLPADNNYARASGVVWIQLLSDHYYSLSLRYSPAYQIYFRYASVADIVSDDSSSAIIDQTNKHEQHWQAEEEQRQEDENKANQTGDGSKTDADNAQSDLDGASKGLFDVITAFTGAITGATPGSCNISGNFGFFDVGGIDLCTGASKITPITNVVGSVMLIGLTIPACVTLLHRFVDLYNEVMG